MPDYSKFFIDEEHKEKIKKIKKKRKLRTIKNKNRIKSALLRRIIAKFTSIRNSIRYYFSETRKVKNKLQKLTPEFYNFSTVYLLVNERYTIIEIYNMDRTILEEISQDMKMVFKRPLEKLAYHLEKREVYDAIFNLLVLLDDKWVDRKRKVNRQFDEKIRTYIRNFLSNLEGKNYSYTVLRNKIEPLYGLSKGIKNKLLQTQMKAKISNFLQNFGEVKTQLEFLISRLDLYQEKLEKRSKEKNTQIIDAIKLLKRFLSKYDDDNYIVPLTRVLFSQTDPKVRKKLKSLTPFIQEFERFQFSSLKENFLYNKVLQISTWKRYERNRDKEAIKFFGLEKIYEEHLAQIWEVKFPDQFEEIQKIMEYTNANPNWLNRPKEILLRFDRINPHRKAIPELKKIIGLIFGRYRYEMIEFKRISKKSAIKRGNDIIDLLRRYSDIFRFHKKINFIKREIEGLKADLRKKGRPFLANY